MNGRLYGLGRLSLSVPPRLTWPEERDSPRAGPSSLLEQERRLSTVLQVARGLGTSPRLVDLLALLPEGPVETPGDLARWLESHPQIGSVRGEVVAPRGAPPVSETTQRRRAAAEVRWREAVEEAPKLMRPVLSLVRAVVVTGSVSYGESDEDDDLDFFVITRRGALWPFLLFIYVALRLRSRAGRSEWCFNHVLDESDLPRALREWRGFLEARELLVARPIFGEEYFRQVLASTPWIREEVPRLYAQRGSPAGEDLLSHDPAPWGIRALNAASFPWVASYLQLVGTRRSGRYRREGRPLGRFRTITRLRQLSYLSEKFDWLRGQYHVPDTRTTTPSGGRDPSPAPGSPARIHSNA